MKAKLIKMAALGLSAAMLLGTMAGCGNKKSSTAEAPAEESSESPYFIMTLYPDYAPETCANFEKLVEEGFYDGLTFHRVVDEFMAQGGDPNGDGTGGSDETVVGEFSENGFDNPLSHTRGIVSMARSSEYDSASSQFFICYGDESFLDGSYAAFAEVTEGMDVVDSFCDVERTANSMGEEAIPTTDIVMEQVYMIDDDEDGNPQVCFVMNNFLGE